jgi:two-component system NtrC family sensor kinase
VRADAEWLTPQRLVLSEAEDKEVLVARHWRIRHKLMLGLGLVVALMAVLVGGTLKGLASYRDTVRTIDAKLVELSEAHKLREKVQLLGIPNKNHPDEDNEFIEETHEARQAFESLREVVLQLGQPSIGHTETEQIKALEEAFDLLDQVVTQAVKNPDIGVSRPLSAKEEISKALQKLMTACNDFNTIIYDASYHRIKIAKNDGKLSLAIVLTTSIVGVLLMIFLLRWFYRWIVYPIRDLEAGVGKVARGDFDHYIKIMSGDEIEDLAAAFNDMTGRLREMYRDLARQVNERSRQLVRSERLAGVGFLAAGVAHEINNPLASIAFCSEALERRIAEVLENPSGKPAAPADAEVISKYLRMIQQEAFRCKEITQRLLEFSRGGERRREPTDLGELIQAVLDMVQHLQNCRGKHLVFKPVGRHVAWVNSQEIKSVVLNLVVNALDSMDEGGTLAVTLSQRDGMAQMVFKDSGCGMTAEVLENIFEPFFTRSRTGKGTGLGLSISHRIINQHGGEIEAVSEGPEQGSTFTVRLPQKPAEDERAVVSDTAPAESDYGEQRRAA